MIYDIFIFYNELDLLEIRLKELEPYVDMFVLVESRKTFSGKDKPLYFTENKERYAKYNIKTLIVEDDELESKNPWAIEHMSRNYATKWINENLSDEDLIFSSDLDEIPDFRTFNVGQLAMTPLVLQSILYYYNMGWMYPSKWKGTIVLHKKDLNNTTLTKLRTNSPRLPYIDSGWHLSYFFDEHGIHKKIDAFSHQELNTMEYNDLAKHKARMELGLAITDMKTPVYLLKTPSTVVFPRTYAEFPAYMKRPEDR